MASLCLHSSSCERKPPWGCTRVGMGAAWKLPEPRAEGVILRSVRAGGARGSCRRSESKQVGAVGGAHCRQGDVGRLGDKLSGAPGFRDRRVMRARPCAEVTAGQSELGLISGWFLELHQPNSP